jgi:hypothetical protein
MPAHQAKRPYGGTHSQTHNQSSITSYFHPSPSGNQPVNSSSQPQNHGAPTLSPQLPASVQSNLLSVGMRVRKAVPDGYKTGGFSAFNLFSDTNLKNPYKPETLNQMPTRNRTQGAYTSGRNELAPFCGIMKVGGMAQQIDNYEGDDVPAEEDVPFLSSQESMLSEASDFQDTPPSNKRRLEEEEDDTDVQILDFTPRERIWLEELSPKSKPADVGRPWGTGIGGRPLAQPKSRKRGAEGQPSKLSNVLIGEQENVIPMDFEEAEFLDYGIWKGEEVVMSGV